MDRSTDNSRIEARRRSNARYWARNKDRISQQRRARRALLGTLYAQYLAEQMSAAAPVQGGAEE